MPDPTQADELSEEVRNRFQQIVADFAQAWRDTLRGSGEVRLESYLPQKGDSLRLPVLRELIPLDLEQRRKRGESVLLEKYLARFPELGPPSQAPVELIWAEYRIRSEQGDPLRLETYRSRFPRQYESLAALIASAPPGSIAPSAASTGKPGDVPTPKPRSLGTLQPEEEEIASKRTVADAGQATPTPAPDAPPAPPEMHDVARKVMPVGEGYKLLNCIGRGMFGEVYRAEAPGGVEVAVKLIHRTEGNQLTQMELRALELMKRLRHPFLLQVQAYWLAGDQLHIVMDLAEKTLLQRLEECQRKGKVGIPPQELLLYFREAAEALDFLHSNQVLHRDIKPANILLSNGHARLADFGLARLFMKSGSDMRATMTGTPLYMGPEVWQRTVAPESDQYSLAATYVELRLGHPLFEADSQDQVKQNHMTTAPNLKGLPAAERKVLQKALAKRLDERFKTCSQFVEALELAALGPSLKKKSWLTRRRALVLLTAGALGTALSIEVARRNQWFRGGALGLEVTAPSTLSVHAGEDETFEIHILGAKNQVKPIFSDVPTGVEFTLNDATTTSSEANPNQESATRARVFRVRVSADLNMPQADKIIQSEVNLKVADGAQSVQRRIRLSVSPPEMTLPPGCEPVPGAKRVRVIEEGGNYWSRIVRRLPNDIALPSNTPCELVLIPYNGTLKLPSFYMQVNKVWNELFSAFDNEYLSAHPQRAKGEAAGHDELDQDWPDVWSTQGAAKGADDMPAAKYPLHPVMKVNFKQAQEFARWLGGALPTCEQWDTAAGVYLPDVATRQGPFLGEWSKAAEPGVGIAINREGTLSIQEANDDVSPFGCRHMAGNGAEWTRDATEGAFSSAPLRGRQYFKEEPLQYVDLLDKNKQTRLESEDVTATSPYIGFRIVIEMPASSSRP